MKWICIISLNLGIKKDNMVGLSVPVKLPEVVFRVLTCTSVIELPLYLCLGFFAVKEEIFMVV